jgi:hypothetical protein
VPGVLLLDWTEIDIYREFCAILTTGPQFKTRTHRSRDWVTVIALTVVWMTLAETLRQQRFNSGAVQLATGISEQTFGFAVYQDYVPSPIDFKNRIRRRLEQLLKACFDSDLFGLVFHV